MLRITRPKLIPTLVCFAIVGFVAAILPYPTSSHRVGLTHTSD